MSALILRAPSSLISPAANHPKVPDILSNQLWRARASSLIADLPDGATVPAWIAEGTDTEASRTFSVAGSGWNLPTIAHDADGKGHPALMFDGTQQIANSTGTSDTQQPTTWAIVFKSVPPYGGQERIISVNSQVIRSFSDGLGMVDTSNNKVTSGVAPLGWTVVVAVFNGEESKLKVGKDGEIATGFAGSGHAMRCYIGGQSTGRTSLGMVGGVMDLQKFSRAFTDSDIEAIALSLSREYGLT
jgi:hypothetical protein